MNYNKCDIMKNLKIISAIGLFIVATFIIGSSSFAQPPGFADNVYKVEVTLSKDQVIDNTYLIEITDQFGRLIGIKEFHPDVSVYLFNETVRRYFLYPMRTARFVPSPNNHKVYSEVLWAKPDIKKVGAGGTYNFNLIVTDNNNASQQ
jgi:hypothetical protein